MQQRQNSALAMAAGQQPQAGMIEGLTPQQMQHLKMGYQIGQNVVYDQNVFGQIIQGVDSQDPVQTLAMVLVRVIDGIDQKLGGVDLPVLLGIGIKLLDDIAGAIAETGRPQVTAEQAETAIAMAVQEWLGAHADRVPPEEMQALMQQAGGMPS